MAQAAHRDTSFAVRATGGAEPATDDADFAELSAGTRGAGRARHMGRPEHVRFLLEELGRWRQSGLIDGATADRLHGLYADIALERDLEEHASFHLEVERRENDARAFRQAAWRRLAEKPPETRPARIADAARAALADVASVDLGEPPKSTESEIVERESAWSRFLRPLLTEHAPWIAGGLLVLFGSLHFLTSIWHELSSVPLRAVITVALHAYAAAFAGVALVLGRREAYTASRALTCFSLALLPLGAVALGELVLSLTTPISAAGVVLALLAIALSLAAQGALLWVSAGLFERRAALPVAFGGVGLALVTALFGLAGHWLPVLVGAGIFAAAARAIAARVRWKAAALVALGATTWALVVLGARAQYSLGLPATHWTPLLAAMAAILIGCDHELRLRAGFAPRLGGVGLGLHCVLLGTLFAALAGLVRQGWLDGGARSVVVVVSAAVLVVFARSASRHGRSALTIVAAASGLLVYFFFPSLFKGLLESVASSAGRALGYDDRPLPVAFYGIALMPYLGGTALLATLLRKRRQDLARDLAGFVLVTSVLVGVLALTSPGDLRAALMSWPVYAAGAFALSRWLGTRAVYVGHAFAFGTLAALGITAERAGLFAPPSVLLAGGALAAAALALRGARHLVHAAVFACGAALFALVLPETTPAAVALTLALLAPALALVAVVARASSAAYAAVLALLAAVLAGCVALGVSELEAFFAAVATGVLLSLVRVSLLRAPALVGATIALLAGFTSGLAIAPGWAILASALLVLLALSVDVPRISALAAAALAAAVALSAGAWFSPALALAAPVLLAAARHRRAGDAVAWVSAAAAALALYVSGFFALPGSRDAALWGLLASAGASAYAAAGVWLYRRRRPALAAVALGPCALGAALALSFAIEHFAELSAGTALWVHASVLSLTSVVLSLYARRSRIEDLSRMARAVGWALVVLPALGVAAVLLSSLVEHSAEVPPLAALTAAVSLLAVWLGSRERVARAACAVLATCAGTLALASIGGGHTATWLLVVAGLAALARAPIGAVALACGLALAGGHLHAARAETWLALALLAAVSIRKHPVAGSVAAVLSVQALTIQIAALVSTGRHPAAAVFAALGVAALASAIVLRRLGRATPGMVSTAHGTLVASALLGFAGVLLCRPAVPDFVVLFALAVLAVASLLCLWWGSADRRQATAHGAALLVPLAWAVARLETPLAAPGPAFDAVALVVASSLVFWISRALSQARPTLARAAGLAARLWPLAAIGVALSLSMGGAALLAFLVALHYSVLARLDSEKRFAVLAAGFANASLFASFAVFGFGDVLAYALPIGISALVLVHVYAAELGEATRQRLRVLILGALYALSGAQVIAVASPTQALVVIPAVCVAGIAAGVLLRVRAYLVMSTAFLALDLALQMLRHGLENRPLGALFLTLLGLLLVGAMVAFSLERDRILRRYAGVVSELRRWE